MWNCIVNIIAAHRLPLNAIQLKFDQNGINFATDATVCWIVMLCVCMVCIYMFVGLLCLILTDTVFVVMDLDKCTTKVSHKTYYTGRLQPQTFISCGYHTKALSKDTPSK